MFPNQQPQPPPNEQPQPPPNEQPQGPKYLSANHFVTMPSLAHFCEPTTEAGKATRRELATDTHLPPMPNACDTPPSHTPFGPRPWGKEEEQHPEQPVFGYGQPKREQPQQGEQEDVWNKVYQTGGPLGALPRATHDPNKPWTLPRDYYACRDEGI
jgi:hypothetical protein